MKFSLSWLKNYVDVSIPAEKLAYKLTMAGLEVIALEKKLSDWIFEIEITPNRPDWLSIIGIAREVAAITDKKLRIPKTITLSNLKKSSNKVNISVKNKKACQRYIGTIIQGVSVRFSPAWLIHRLESVGMRPVNNIVDITNYCLLETGQPLHAFDLDRLSGGKVIVRKAKPGEKITTIDGVERSLDSDILVIADSRKPVAIAGVMGGLDTEVCESTKNILLESAYFNPILIRRASRKLGLSSESSYRFERFVDFAGVAYGSLRASQLICDIAQGKIAAAKDCKEKLSANKDVILDIKYANRLLGMSVSLQQAKHMLTHLGFTVRATKSLIRAKPPSFRRDINTDVDLIEELARCRGYDNIPFSSPRVKPISIKLQQDVRLRPLIRETMIACGMREVVTYALVSQELLAKTNTSSATPVFILNPLSKEQAVLRPTALPSMLSCMSYNFRRNQKNIKLFEISKKYSHNNAKFNEQSILTIGLTGEDIKICLPDKKVSLGQSLFHVKGIIENLLKRLGIYSAVFSEKRAPMFSQDGVVIIVEGKQIGILGKVSDEVLKNLDFKAPSEVLLAEINLSELYPFVDVEKTFVSIDVYPEVTRDISLVVQKKIKFSQLKEIVQDAGGFLLRSVNLVDYYSGGHIPKDSKGLTLSLIFQARDHTLSDTEVSGVFDSIRNNLKHSLNAEIR